MRGSNSTLWTVVLWNAIAFFIGGCGSRSVDSKAEQVFLQSLGSTSITVFPAFVRQGEKTSRDAKAAAEIGTFLKKENLADVTISDRHVPVTSPWRSNQSKMWRESVKAFVSYLRAHPCQTAYALLPEYLLGKTGAVGIHCYIVDAHGTLAYGIGLNSHHKPFASADPKTSGNCTAVLINVARDRLKSSRVRRD